MKKLIFIFTFLFLFSSDFYAFAGDYDVNTTNSTYTSGGNVENANDDKKDDKGMKEKATDWIKEQIKNSNTPKIKHPNATTGSRG